MIHLGAFYGWKDLRTATFWYEMLLLLSIASIMLVGMMFYGVYSWLSGKPPSPELEPLYNFAKFLLGVI